MTETGLGVRSGSWSHKSRKSSGRRFVVDAVPSVTMDAGAAQNSPRSVKQERELGAWATFCGAPIFSSPGAGQEQLHVLPSIGIP